MLSEDDLRAASCPRLQGLDRVLRRGIKNLSDEERGWVERIEAERKVLLADDSEVEILNFGAGSRTARRTANEMNAGWTSHAVIRQVCERAVSKPEKALLLFKLVREFRPQRAVEFGTCLGISAAYQAAALQLNGNGGSLATLEGAPSFGDVARRTLDAVSLSEVEVVVGRFLDTLPQVLADGPVDYAFVDGHHDEAATINYFRELLPHLSDGAVLVFDDIRWNDRMQRAWGVIAASPSVVAAVDLVKFGIVFVGREPCEPPRFDGAVQGSPASL